MIVGVDIGSQTLKVAVLDSALRMRGRSVRSYPISHPRPGWVEQDPGLWEAALGPAIAEALTSAGTKPAAVAGDRILRPARRLHRRRCGR